LAINTDFKLKLPIFCNCGSSALAKICRLEKELTAEFDDKWHGNS
jgi:hypothetical protein